MKRNIFSYINNRNKFPGANRASILIDIYVNKKTYLIFILAGFLLTTCVTPFEVPYNGVYKKYVVTGYISDHPGPFTINITYSTPYSASTAGTNYPVKNAKVTIIDADSNNEEVSKAIYDREGRYHTGPYFYGIPGHHYILHIITLNNDELRSYPELLAPMSPNVSIHYEFVPETSVHPEGDRVWITMNDLSGTKNYYRWQYEGVYQFTTELNQSTQGMNNTNCWQYEYFHNDLILASDESFNGMPFSQDITVVPYFASTPYLITVYTQSLTEDAYNYWKVINKQINNPGGIFSPPPQPIKGNMYCVNNPDLQVLGYFVASSEVKSQIFITRAVNLPVKYPRQYDPIDCGTYTNAVPITCCPVNYPDGWPE